MRTIAVDYSRIGYADSFTTPLLTAERHGLEVGTVVEITGDAVPPRRARVEDLLDDGRVCFKFLDPLPTP